MSILQKGRHINNLQSHVLAKDKDIVKAIVCIFVAGIDSLASCCHPWATGVLKVMCGEVQAGRQPSQFYRMATSASCYKQPDWPALYALPVLSAREGSQSINVSIKKENVKFLNTPKNYGLSF